MSYCTSYIRSPVSCSTFSILSCHTTSSFACLHLMLYYNCHYLQPSLQPCISCLSIIARAALISRVLPVDLTALFKASVVHDTQRPIIILKCFMSKSFCRHLAAAVLFQSHTFSVACSEVIPLPHSYFVQHIWSLFPVQLTNISRAWKVKSCTRAIKSPLCISGQAATRPCSTASPR